MDGAGELASSISAVGQRNGNSGCLDWVSILAWWHSRNKLGVLLSPLLGSAED